MECKGRGAGGKGRWRGAGGEGSWNGGELEGRGSGELEVRKGKRNEKINGEVWRTAGKDCRGWGGYL